MPTSAFSSKTALIVGVGGLGCPVALVLARAGVNLVLADDDEVQSSNLHRQILFSKSDLGRDKLEAARDTLLRDGTSSARIQLARSRVLPDNARELIRNVDLVLEGADNFATKFLCADAALLEQRPIVHGAAIRFRGTAWAIHPNGAPCYRCLFEDLPPGDAAPNCASAGVMGPVAGFVGALMADLALSILQGNTARFNQIYTYDGKQDRLRSAPVGSRKTCGLCGPHRTIHDIHESRYLAPACIA